MKPIDLTSRVMLASLSISVFTGEKIDRKISEEIADKHQVNARESGKYAKQVISKHALEPTRRIAGAARERHYTLTLPWSDLGGRLLSVEGYFGYLEQMRSLKSQFHEEIDRFVKAYPTLIEEARGRLNGMFDPADYPPIDTLLGRFEFETSMTPLPSSKNWFLEIAAEEMAALQSEADARLQTNIQSAVKDTYRRIADVTGKMIERLKLFDERDPETGKPSGVFRNSLVENVRDLAEILPSLNITGDVMLGQITTEMRAQLCKFDADALRSDVRFRQETMAAAQSILTKVEGLF